MFYKDSDQNSSLNILRWRVFFWIISVSEDQHEQVKALSNLHRLIVVTLLFMVQVSFATFLEKKQLLERSCQQSSVLLPEKT